MIAEKNSSILVLGGGPAGISSAYELSRKGYSPWVFEQFSMLGGLSKTFRFGDFYTDIGPHRFFSKNQYLYDLIGDVLKEDWILVNRFTRFYINGKFYMYPVDLKDALRNMGLVNAALAFFDYLKSKIGTGLFHPPVNNFEDYAVQEFGRMLAQLNMLNYTEKIWGIPCSTISADWARQRIKGLSLVAVVKNSLFKNQKGPKTLVDQFYYPRWGAGQTYEKMGELTVKNGGRIELSSEVVKVRHSDGKIISVVLRGPDGAEREVSGDFVISSIPITRFAAIMDPAPPDEIIESAKSLKWRAQVYLYLQLKKERVSRDNWVYFPDRDIPFGRMHEAKNFSPDMSPKDRTSLWVEHFVFTDDERWEMGPDELKNITLKDLDRLGFVKEQDVEDFRKHREEYVYPVYELGYQKHADRLKEYLESFSNLQLVGRPGRFRYNNQDHSIETGILAARNLIEGAGYSLEDVGAEQEYFEKYQLQTGSKE